MSNFKKITEVPVAESTENINLIANSNGAAVQVPANQIGAQADWNETDESSPAFIMNKPTGGGGVFYTIYSGRLCDSNWNDISWDTFVEQFDSGVTIRCKRVGSGDYHGTIVGYGLSDDNKILTVALNGSVIVQTIE